jgi:hypothetical protein
MRAKRQQGDWYQRRLFGEDGEPTRLGQGGEEGIRSSRCEEPQPLTASDQTRTLTIDLLGRICHRVNLNQAYQKVKANKRQTGMTVDEQALRNHYFDSIGLTNRPHEVHSDRSGSNAVTVRTRQSSCGRDTLQPYGHHKCSRNRCDGASRYKAYR